MRPLLATLLASLVLALAPAAGHSVSTTGHQTSAVMMTHDTPRCTTDREWRRAKRGYTLMHVRWITDVWGRVESRQRQGGDRYMMVSMKACPASWVDRRYFHFRDKNADGPPWRLVWKA